MEKRNSAKGALKRIEMLMLSAFIATVLLPGFLLLIPATVLLSLSLKFLEFLNIKVNAFCLKVLWHKLVFFRSEISLEDLKEELSPVKNKPHDYDGPDCEVEDEKK